MKIKKSNILYYITIIALSIVFVFLYQISFAQTYVPITNYHNGISIGIQGTQGSDYVFDRYYFDPLINDCGLCYIKSDVDIELSHNEYNSRTLEKSTVIIGGDFGDIRYKIDMDWKNDIKWAGTGTCYPLYPGPLSFEDMEYESGVPVVGTIGFKPGTSPSDRSEYYGRGMLDAVGNEYHYMTYADDDDAEPDWKNLEMSASDGKSMLFCVNPKTPAIWLRATNSYAQYYTTPAKVYWVPKVFEQTSYVTDNVEIQLKNIMNSNTVYYRIDGGSYQAYTGPINSNTLSNGEHTLEFYYNSSYIQTRKIVKNPDHPSKQDVFEDGSGHGYLFWRNEADFLRFKERMLNGVWSNGDYYFRSYYQYKSDFLDDDLSYVGNEGIRNNGPTGDAMYAVVGILEGIFEEIEYMRTAKTLLMNNERMHIECIGWEGSHTQDPIPSKELNYRGYYDDSQLYNNAFAYDLLVAHFRSDQHPEGITPIEDFRLRDMIAQPVHEGMMFHGGYWNYTEYDVDVSPMEAMWPTAHQNAAVMAALAMPGYNTNYYGTAGFDGTLATHEWTPYPEHPETWKDVFLTYTDKDNSAHLSRLHPFPNRKSMFNWYDGSLDEGLVRADGNWHDRIPYCREYQMGHGIEYFYNVMKRKFDKTYPALDIFMEKSIDGTLYCYKDEDYANYPRRNMANEYFPVLAPIVIDFDPDDKYFYMIKPYYHFFHNPNYADDIITCDSPDAPTIPTNLSDTPDETTIALSWSASTHSECSVTGYKIKRNGTIIATVFGTQYTDAGLTSGVQYSYSVASISEAGVTSDYCSEIQVTTLTDQIAPQIQLASNISLTSVSVKFDEPVDPVTAETASNYSINNGISIASAQLLGDNLTVGLVVSTLSPGTQYTVTVNNVEDLAGNAIAANSTVSFTALDVQTNIALNMPVTVSAEQAPDNIGSNLVDGNTGDDSRWAAEPMPQWAEIDLGADYDLTEIDVYTYSSRAYQYTIEAKPDGGSYSVIIDRTANTDASPITDVVSGTARYIKISVTGASDYTGTWASINEIQVYGSLAASGSIPVTGVSVSPTTLTINEGQTSDLTETISPADATDQSVTWSTSDADVAIVDANGLVTAISAGNATITVTTNDGGYTATCNISVNEVSGTTTLIEAEDYTSTSGCTIDTQHSGFTGTGFVDYGGEGTYAEWTNIDGGSGGTTTLTVRYANGGSTSRPCDVEVNGQVVGAVTLSPTSDWTNWVTESITIDLNAGSVNTIRITANSSEGGPNVDNFEVTTSGSGCNPVTSVSLNNTSATLDVSETLSLTATVLPVDACDNSVTWNSSDNAIATVDANGLVTAISAGNATITVTTNEGVFTDDCFITVTAVGIETNLALGKPVTVSDEETPDNIGSNLVDDNTEDASRWAAAYFPQWAEIDLGEDCNLTRMEVYPYLDRDYQYIIEVSSDGINYTTAVDRSSNAESANALIDNVSVTGRYVRITVSGANTYTGSWVSLTEVMVFGTSGSSIVNVTGVSVSSASLNLDEGQTSDLTETISPVDATDQTVTWSSNNPSIATVSISGVVTAISAGSATITVTTNDGGFSAQCAVTISTGGTEVNLALVKPVTVSDEETPDNIGSKLVDDNTDDASRWAAAYFPQWAEIDLGVDCDLTRMEVYPYLDRDYQYIIEAKTDGGSYATVVDRSSNTEGGNALIDNVTVNARYIRITITGANTYRSMGQSCGNEGVWLPRKRIKINNIIKKSYC